MLYLRLTLFLLALHSATSQKKDTKLGKKLYFPKAICRNIKCPPVEEPVCAKLVYKHVGNMSFYVEMINKCEMKYMKCVDGLEASIVPMKNCGHEESIKPNKRRSKRTKRQIDTDVYYQANNRNKENLILEEKKEFSNSVTPSEPLDEPADEPGLDIPENSGEEHAPGALPMADIGDLKILNFEDLEESRSAELILGPKKDKKAENRTPFPDQTHGDEVDIKQYYADCPTVCPLRDVMACARCQHGVYRTFLSICHMRMFACKHTDEILKLITRLPCVMSAPYIASGMAPRGRVREPLDHDTVLRFIICRQLTERSREEDSRCYFPAPTDTRLLVESYLVNDYY